MLAFACAALVSCVRPPAPSAPQQARLLPLPADTCRRLLREDASATSLRRAVALSLDSLQRFPAERTFPAVDRTVSVADLRRALQLVTDMASDAEDWPQQLCAHLQLLRVDVPGQAGEAPLLVTGYYEPEVRARRQRDEQFRHPLYRPPDDLVDIDLRRFCEACLPRTTQGRLHERRVVPYHTRAEIDAGALTGQGYELAWLDDPVEAFFLHVQGSGKLRFDDGTHMQVSFARANGHAYRSIGSVLVERGKLPADSVSLTAIKDYLRAHPEESAEVMARNERYVFFRAVPVGPVGSLGVPLTAGRSLAADARVYPRSALVFLRFSGDERRPSDGRGRLAVIQDSGAAIQGAQRLDVFWGSGAAAEAIAGDMRAAGELYLLLPAAAAH